MVVLSKEYGSYSQKACNWKKIGKFSMVDFGKLISLLSERAY
jgi:hypothetical protein